uniref:MD-2-related lipid-recognition domain-containing protein n=1 Tax=Anopheles culicifacies TaxID=139723 RepID=A0A182LXU9_9DIPT
MNILSRSAQCTTFICCVAIVFFSIAFSFAATRSNRKFLKGIGNASHIVRITKMQCIETPYKLSHLNYCYMVQLPNGTVGLNTSLDIPQVLNYLEITAKVYYKYTTYRPFMIDWTIELCQADRIGKFNPSTALVMKFIAGTVPEFYYPCPHGNRTYATFWIFEPSYVPSSLPSGDYRVDIYFRDTSRTVLYAIQMFCSMRKQGLLG